MAKTSFFCRLICAAVIAAAAVGVSSCGSSKSISGDKGYVKTTKHGNNKKSASSGHSGASKAAKTHFDTDGLDAATAAVIAEAESWQGTPYAWGGNTREGVDCSGFVTQVYLRALGIALPRTSRTQQEYCSGINKKDMVPGDLLFFTTSDKHSNVSHVGIYVGADRMIHSSSSRGVIVTDINSDYWLKHFHSAGRIANFYAMTSNSKKSHGKHKKEKEKTKEKTKPAAPAPELMAQKPSAPSRRNTSPAQVAEMTNDDFASMQVKAPKDSRKEAVKSAPATNLTETVSADAKAAVLKQEKQKEKIPAAAAQTPAAKQPRHHTLRQGESKQPKSEKSIADVRANVLAGLDD